MEIVYVAQPAGLRVHGARATDPNSMQLDIRATNALTQKLRRAVHRSNEPEAYGRGALLAGENSARMVDDSYGDLGSPNVNPGDHVAIGRARFWLVFSFIFRPILPIKLFY